MEVSNPANSVTEDFVVQIYVNKNVKDVAVSSDIINTEIPEFEFKKDEQTIYFYIEELEAGESRSFLVDFENVDEDDLSI